MVIKDGNVGIGKNDPSTKLDVEGVVTATAYVGNGIVVAGMIVMWSGSSSNIPAGWAMCNGENGTPDLRDLFIVGAGKKYQPAEKGGLERVKLSELELPKHHHSGSTGSGGDHNHVWNDDFRDWLYIGQGHGGYHDPGTHGAVYWKNKGTWIPFNASGNIGQDTKYASAHEHGFSTSDVGADKHHENRPPYYAMIYIMKI